MLVSLYSSWANRARARVDALDARAARTLARTLDALDARALTVGLVEAVADRRLVLAARGREVRPVARLGLGQVLAARTLDALVLTPLRSRARKASMSSTEVLH